MRTIDLSPLYRSFIGSDRLASLVDSASRNDTQQQFPPYNIEVLGEDKYQISMALAGFSEQQVTIEVQDNTLVVSGNAENKAKDNAEKRQFLHQGISARSFERKFSLSDHVEVTGAAMHNGLLEIALARIVPEEKKPKSIAIGSSKPN